ncbi:FAD:protein FMN transferase [Nonomuraea roseoviolacea]|uniref:FAD:protein FMN transferase n=1 Tax=Nonomuraea roseoviolacea TaxID=103837 RepID=UPI0020A4B1E0|nr:FAD:protein FMN transferase [Nonomuraea roseoviolacea]
MEAGVGRQVDPSRLVKGWAIERASGLLTAAGAPRHTVNGGGDVRLGAGPEPGRPWRVGAAAPPTAAGHPARDALLTVVAGSDLAVATSGTAERGHHILESRTGRPATALASVTLVGPCLTTVDAYATAAFAMGQAARDWEEDMDDLEALAVTATGETWRTSGFHRHVPPWHRSCDNVFGCEAGGAGEARADARTGGGFGGHAAHCQQGRRSRFAHRLPAVVFP